MKARRRNFKKSTDPQNFWPSFTDMISTIALILFFLMLLMNIQKIITQKDLEGVRTKLQETQDHLEISGKDLEFAKKQLVDTKKKLEESNAEISQAEKKLRLLNDQLKDVKAEVEEGEIALTLSEEQIDKQKQIIAESNQELGKLRARLQGIALLRLNVVKKVKSTIEEELGKTMSGEQLVLIGDNGNIVINDRLMFGPDSYQIKADGKPLLDNLAMVFERVLDDESIRENIDAINIEGHTDDVDTAEYNRDLSAKRAISVVNYLMASNPDLENKYGRYFAASAYSEFRPIAKGTSSEARAKNRRIEISIILRDSNVQKVIDQYLKDSMDIFENREQ